MTQFSRLAFAAIGSLTLGLSSTVSAQQVYTSPVAPGSQGTMGPSMSATPEHPPEDQWSMRVEAGACTIRKGPGDGPELVITSRGRIMFIDADLPDPTFEPQEIVGLTLRWSDGKVEKVNGATHLLPGGGTRKLRPGKAVVFMYDTVALADRFKQGFKLAIDRSDDVPSPYTIFTFDALDSAGVLTAMKECSINTRRAQ